MIKKYLYFALYYLSIIIVVVYLFKSGSINFLKLGFNFDFFLSLIFLTAGFLIYPFVLNRILNYQGIKSDYETCFLAIGRTIFSKYIPGKVAMIYSISYNLKKNTEASLSRISYNVILFQVFIIISGLILGLSFVFQIDDINPLWKYSTLLIILSVILILRSEFIFRYLTKFVTKQTGKEYDLPHFSGYSIFLIIFISLLFWLCWGIGIYFLITSMGICLNNQFSIIFLFPFSVCLGIIAVISPGGIGIREGVLAGFIVYLGNSASAAAEISVSSRIWFILGEIIFFLIAYIFPYLYRKFSMVRK